MDDFFDTRQVPDDAAYWDGLAERVAGEAGLRSRGHDFESIVQSRASWVAASLLVAGTLAFTIGPTDTFHAESYSAVWKEVVAPADDLGNTIVVSEVPPIIGGLLELQRERRR